MSDRSIKAPPASPDLTDDEKHALIALLQAAPTLRAALGPSINPPGDPHYTWADFTRDSPQAQAEVLAQAQQLAQALSDIAELQKQLAAAKAQMNPEARKAELQAELDALNAAQPPAADASGAQPGAGQSTAEAAAAGGAPPA